MIKIDWLRLFSDFYRGEKPGIYVAMADGTYVTYHSEHYGMSRGERYSEIVDDQLEGGYFVGILGGKPIKATKKAWQK